jgi:hypothetical protein
MLEIHPSTRVIEKKPTKLIYFSPNTNAKTWEIRIILETLV